MHRLRNWDRLLLAGLTGPLIKGGAKLGPGRPPPRSQMPTPLKLQAFRVIAGPDGITVVEAVRAPHPRPRFRDRVIPGDWRRTTRKIVMGPPENSR